MKIRIRKGGPEVHGLVRDSWMRHVATHAGMHVDQVSELGDRIDRVLADSQTEILVAEDISPIHAPHVAPIVGVAVRTILVLQWVWVRREARGWGVCRALLDGMPSPMLCWWLSRGAAAVNKVLRLLYDPTAVYAVESIGAKTTWGRSTDQPPPT